MTPTFAFLSHRNRPMQLHELFGLPPLGSRTALPHYRRVVPGFAKAWERIYGARDSIWEPALETRPAVMTLPLGNCRVQVTWHSTGHPLLDRLIKAHLRRVWLVGTERAASNEFCPPHGVPDDAPAEVRRMALLRQTVAVFVWLCREAKSAASGERLVAAMRPVPNVSIDRTFSYPEKVGEPAGHCPGDTDMWPDLECALEDAEWRAADRPDGWKPPPPARPVWMSPPKREAMFADCLLSGQLPK
jgi:hypothetical protein